jgi:hypothetical protein
MFNPIEIPFGCVMLFNEVNLKDGVTVEDVELTLGEMCNVVKNNYGDDNGGFIAGQVYENSGFISGEGSFENIEKAKEERGEIVIVTFWKSFEQHEKSHADELFKSKFDALLEFCDDANELGYKMLWQGTPEDH